MSTLNSTKRMHINVVLLFFFFLVYYVLFSLSLSRLFLLSNRQQGGVDIYMYIVQNREGLIVQTDRKKKNLRSRRIVDGQLLS
jgi:hypothetical protein